MQLSASSLTVRKGESTLLNEVSISFTPGGLHFLIGLNGSGKTTLLRCIGGAYSYTGTIHLDQEELHALPSRKRAQKIAWVPQQLIPYAQFTTGQYVLMGRYPYLNWLGSYTRKDQEIADFYLEKLKLTSLRDRPLNALSGGELQRANLARALTQETPILLLDEPDQSLDPPARNELLQYLFEWAEAGKTLICSTHHLESLSSPTVRVLGMHDGRLVWDKAGGEPISALMQAVYKSSSSM